MATVGELAQNKVNKSTGEIQISKSREEVRAEIEGAIVSARHFPRNEENARIKIIEAVKNPKLAEIARYKFPRGDSQVSGPSVNLARECARIWGNIRHGLNIISDSEDERTIEGWAWDVETNVKATAQDTFKKLIYRKRATKTYAAGWNKPDERDLRELTNRRGAILKRNCILELIPKHIVDEAEDVSTKVLAGAIKDPKASVRKIADAFHDIGVTIDMLQDYLGHKLDLTTAEEVVDLRAVYQSIKDGNSKRDEYFNIQEPSEDKKEKSTAANGTIKTEDVAPNNKPSPEQEYEKGLDKALGDEKPGKSADDLFDDKKSGKKK